MKGIYPMSPLPLDLIKAAQKFMPATLWNFQNFGIPPGNIPICKSSAFTKMPNFMYFL